MLGTHRISPFQLIEPSAHTVLRPVDDRVHHRHLRRRDLSARQSPPFPHKRPHHDSQSISIKRPYVFAVWFAPPKVKVAHYFTPPQNRSSSSTSSGHNWSSLACGHAVVSRAITAAYQRGGTHNSKRPWLNHYWAAMRCMVARYSFARENVISRSTLCTTSW